MQTEEILLRVIFSNQLAFCCIFGALGGVVHILDVRTKLTVFMLISKIIISSMAGLLLFFATYDIQILSPANRITASIVTGFYGSALFRYLAKFYVKQFINQVKNTNGEDSTDD